MNNILNTLAKYIEKGFDEITLTPFVVLAAVVGSITGIKHHQPKSRGEALIILLIGVSVAIFIGSGVASFFGLSEKAETGLSFFLGIIGMSVVKGFIEFGRQFQKDPLGTISSIIGSWGATKKSQSPEDKKDNKDG